MPTPASMPVKEWVELCALDIALLGTRFFWSLFGLRASLPSLEGDPVAFESIWVKVRVAGVDSPNGSRSMGASMNSDRSRVGVNRGLR
jgi:hypothetical protein